MKVKSITLNNFAGYSKVTASFDENVNFLIGSNGSGKTTIGLNAIWFLMQGVAEKASGGVLPLIAERFRFIGPASPTSKNEMVLVDEKRGNAEIKVIRKLTKTGSELSFTAPEDYPATLDQSWLNNLFNIFLIAPKRFLDLSSQQQAQALGIDTASCDTAIADLKKEYTGINAVYRSYGEIAEVEEVKAVDVVALQEKKLALDAELMEQMKQNRAKNKETMDAWKEKCDVVNSEVEQFNIEQNRLSTTSIVAKGALNTLKEKGYSGTEVDEWINGIEKQCKPMKVAANLYPLKPMTKEELEFHPELDELPKDYTTLIDEMPDRTKSDVLQQQIVAASETNSKAQLYANYLEKKKAKDDKLAELNKNKADQSAKEGEKIEYIKKFRFPFNNLTVDDAGGLLFMERPLKGEYFSSGELLKVIPILIATTKPELKYVFLQEFNLLDETKQAEVIDYLTGQGFQLVIEMVGKEKVIDRHSILLRDNAVVDSYDEAPSATLEM